MEVLLLRDITFRRRCCMKVCQEGITQRFFIEMFKKGLHGGVAGGITQCRCFIEVFHRGFTCSCFLEVSQERITRLFFIEMFHRGVT